MIYEDGKIKEKFGYDQALFNGWRSRHEMGFTRTSKGKASATESGEPAAAPKTSFRFAIGSSSKSQYALSVGSAVALSSALGAAVPALSGFASLPLMIAYYASTDQIVRGLDLGWKASKGQGFPARVGAATRMAKVGARQQKAQLASVGSFIGLLGVEATAKVASLVKLDHFSEACHHAAAGLYTMSKRRLRSRTLTREFTNALSSIDGGRAAAEELYIKTWNLCEKGSSGDADTSILDLRNTLNRTQQPARFTPVKGLPSLNALILFWAEIKSKETPLNEGEMQAFWDIHARGEAELIGTDIAQPQSTRRKARL